MELNRRNFLRYWGLAAATSGLSGLLTACTDTTQTSGDTTTQTAGHAGHVLEPSTPKPTTILTTAAVAPTQAVSSQVVSGYAGLDPRNLANFTTPLNLPGSQGVLGLIDISGNSASVEVLAKPATLELLRGKKADLMTYQVSQAGKTYINPIFRVQKGETFSATILNNLNEDTNIHWHGLRLDWRMDGHPSQLIKPGTNFQVKFPIQNRSSTYWYHPHPHKLTPRQAYSGLASFFIVEDEDSQKLSQALDLRLGETDLPVVIQDKLFDESGKPLYLTDAENQFMGMLGDVILANLTVNPYLNVETRLYRLRLLNGSNARTYRLAFIRTKGQEQLPYWLIGTDGGLLDKPYQITELFLSPGERVDILIDIRKLEVDEVVTLKSLAFNPMHNEMEMGEMTSGGHAGHGDAGLTTTPPPTTQLATSASKLADGQEFNVLKLRVKNRVTYERQLPQTLSAIMPANLTGATTRLIVLSQAMMGQGGQMMQWLINSKSYNMEDYPITVKKNSVEIWEFKNEAQSMPHPMHLHGFQFQVLERLNSPAQLKGLATYDKGRLATDLGWKDTVLVWPSETVKIAVNFTHSFEGEQNFVTHCHVLEHEDNGMMLNYRVS